MKTPTAIPLPSGAWRVRIMVDGHTVSITRPTKKEAEKEALALKSGAVKVASGTKHLTLTEAIDAYIEKNRSDLSPSTIRAYRSYQKSRMQTAMNRDISGIADSQWQKWVDAELKEVSAKTVQNVWRLVAPSVKLATGHEPDVRIAKAPIKRREYLSQDQIKKFLAAVKGDKVEIPALLMICSLRASEVADLQWKDIDFTANTAHVRGAAVYDENNEFVHKELTKTDKSNRKVPLIPPLREALMTAAGKPHKPTDYICTMPGISVFKRINSICKANGLPEVGRHGLRHSFASLAFSLGIEPEIAMEIGGWSDLGTMRNIYTHIGNDMIDSRAKQFSSFFAEDE